ncbi:MAG: hypothetical protein IJS58_03150 [Bacilli bacterium]|nr:hypothetical protein [Bacilli bacterium]
MDKIPIFVVNGFIESGKTTFIKEVIENDDAFRRSLVTIILTEEGEVEYEEEWLASHGVSLAKIEEDEELNAKKIEEIDKVYNAEVYVLELNSFFNNEKIEIPEYMTFLQQITIVDAATFRVMFNNMRKVFSSIFKFSDFVIFNRCDGINELASFRRQVRAINQQSQIVFEAKDGSLTTKLDEDLPYDINSNNIYIEDDVYPIWYTEVYDKYEKYFHKTIRLRAFVSGIIDRQTFIIGRNVMVCCANDVQMLGYEVINDTKVKVKEGNNLYMECEVTYEYSKIDKENTVILHAKKINIIPDNLKEVIGM